jgi:histidinol-phosphate aminotransferase
MKVEFAQKVRRMPVYPTASAYAVEGDVAMLASNESPFKPLPQVVAAAQRALEGANRYPDPTNGSLRRALSDRYDVPANRIAIGNGSCDVLLAAGEALLEPGAELVYAWPSFSVYPELAATGATAIQVPLDDRDGHDLERMLAEVTAATQLFIICNPNNPTSTALPLADIAGAIARIPRHVCVILDEAYCEFNVLDDHGSSLALLRDHPNLILLRTFSKVYGLAGLRVGYGLCGSEDLRLAIDQVRQPFFCNVAAQAAALEALRHQDDVERRVTETIAARLELEEGLRELGIDPAPSQANFVWFDLPAEREERDVVDGLARRGVLVRSGAALGREGALRVTVGTPTENRRFLAALAELGLAGGVSPT